MAELRHDLTVLQSETVQAEVMRLQALGAMAKMKNTQPESSQNPDDASDNDSSAENKE